ncbi:hypothetical protein ACFE04_001054 [Oxalis oulophora]
MSYFCGYHLTILTFFFFFFFFFFVESSTAENPWFELTSREDMVKMAGYGEEKLSTVLISGSVLCKEYCLPDDQLLRQLPVKGALVGVHCHTKGNTKSISCSEAVTDEYGDFLIDLPSHLHAIPNLEKICSVKVVRLPKESPCRSTYVRKQNGLKLDSVGDGVRMYTAGSLKLNDLSSKSSNACIKQKRSGTKQGRIYKVPVESQLFGAIRFM